MGWYRLGARRWSIERDGTTLVIIEPHGARRTEQLPTAAATTTRFTILTNQKLRAGWKLERDEPVVASTLPEPPIVYDAQNLELEAAIIEDPDDRERWIVYGDWLQQQGDPRGELIARIAAAETDPRVQRLVDARITRFHRYLHGGLHELEIGLEWGFVRHVAVRGTDLADLARALASPATRLLGSIAVETDDARALAAAVAMIGERAPRSVRTIALTGNVWLHDLAPIEARLPALHRLGLDVKLAPRSPCLAQLIASPLPELRSLDLALHVGDATAVRLLHRRDLDRLIELSIDAPVDAALCYMLATAPFARQLVQLTLPDADAGGADLLLATIDAFPALAILAMPLARIAPSTRVALERRVGELVDIESGRYDTGAE